MHWSAEPSPLPPNHIAISLQAARIGGVCVCVHVWWRGGGVGGVTHGSMYVCMLLYYDVHFCVIIMCTAHKYTQS